MVLKLFQEEAPLCGVNPFVAPPKKTHDENILKLTILLTKIRLYQKQMHLYNAGTTILFVALCPNVEYTKFVKFYIS